MQITSLAFDQGGRIPAVHTCDGANISPPLVFSNVPDDAGSLTLVVDDPDAPAGTFIHWVLYNIDPAGGGIDADSVPAGAAQCVTSAGRPGYYGPCPPSGTHRYFFKLFALDGMLSLPGDASARDLERAMEGHIVESAQCFGIYSRTA